MQCVNHADRPATAICQRCDGTMCAACSEDRAGRIFCATCASFFDQRSGQRPAATQVPATDSDQTGGAPTGGDSTGDDSTDSDQADGLYSGPLPGEAPAEPPSSSSELYEGPLPGEAPLAGTDAPSGDVYQGPEAGALPPHAPPTGDVAATAGPASVAAAQSIPLRGVLAALLGAGIGALLYYWMYMSLDLKMKFFILIIAAIVGFAARIGAGRGGIDIGIAAAGLFVVAVIVGDYSVNRGYDDQFAAEEEAIRRAFSEIRLDGRYTADEARQLLGYTSEEWAALPQDEQTWEREIVEDEHASARAEGVNIRELYTFDDSVTNRLTLGSYLGNLLLYLGIWGMTFLVLGIFQAYRIGAAEGDA